MKGTTYVHFCHTCGYKTDDRSELYCPLGHPMHDFEKPKIETGLPPNVCPKCQTERRMLHGRPRPACHVCGHRFS